MKDVRDVKAERDYKSVGDRELIQMFSDGDRRAFDEFYKRYYMSLMRFIMAYCGNRSLAEDVVQDIFLKLLDFKVRHGLVRNIKSYIYSSALNRCRDIIRKEKKGSSLNRGGEDEVFSDERADGHIDIDIMHRFIEKLPEKQKEVLLLRTKSELMFREIGELLGMSENSAKVNYFYALTSLKKMMGGRENE
ncbi:MAG: sigma-70 family RNA polymerase sigma factor [Deltaproteobacteria bacterium]|nr:sigma-70 family RNA polymerase sigma factor [Deltaproteobacteria bacterium]